MHTATKTQQRRVLRVPVDREPGPRSALVARLTRAVEQQAARAAHTAGILGVAEVSGRGGDLAYAHAPVTATARLRRSADLLDLAWIARGCLRALAGAELVHGGLCPRSVLLDSVGRVVLTDFGVAQAYVHCGWPIEQLCLADSTEADGSGTWEHAPSSADVAGDWLACYRSPEQLLDGGFGQSADQFALGVTLFVLAAGRHPYRVDLRDPDFGHYLTLDPDGIGAALQINTPTRQEAGIIAVIQRLMAGHPSARFATAAAALEALRAHLPPSWADLGQRLDTLAETWDDDVRASLAQHPEIPSVARACLAGRDDGAQHPGIEASHESGWVLYLHGPDGAATHVARSGTSIIVGRGRRGGATIALAADEHISRRHLELTCENDHLLAKDLESKHGVYLNRGRLRGTVHLASGDVLRLGSTTLRVVAERERQVLFDGSHRAASAAKSKEVEG